MASADLWEVDSELSKGVDIINKIDGTKFLLITNRIVKAISKDLDEPFTTEERDKLQHSLELSPVEVDQLISTTTHILKKAIFHIIKPAALHKHMVETLRMEEERAVAFSQLWSTEAESLVNAMKQKSLYSHQVTGIDWSTNVAIKSDKGDQELEPRAEIKLNIRNQEDILLDLNHQELTKLYSVLENIQSQLDALN